MNDVEAHELVTATARSARVAQRSLARVPRAVKDAALEAMAHSLTEHGEAILAANAADLERGRQGGMKPGLLARLARVPTALPRAPGAPTYRYKKPLPSRPARNRRRGVQPQSAESLVLS